MNQVKVLLAEVLEEILAEMGVTDVTPEFSRPEHAAHGDYSTNVAMVVSGRLRRKPIEVAEEIKKQLFMRKSALESSALDQKESNITLNSSVLPGKNDVLQALAGIEVAPPGFLNLSLSASGIINLIHAVPKGERYVLTGHMATLPPGRKSVLPPRGATVMVEFAHPNTHKAFHIGHLRNITTGETMVRLLEAAGYEVVRANYQGDVGMHIAKCLYSILHLPDFALEKAAGKPITEKVEFLGKAYAAGSAAFEADPQAKERITAINKQIYARDPAVYDVYRETRQWSLDYFETIYKRVGTHYDRYYFEGEVYEAGKQAVLEGLHRGIFAESDGAVIFPGEKFKLHNRVFITGEGNPTYEGKDIGLAPLQFAEYHPELIIHVVGPEQAGYFQVVFEAVAQLYPETRGKEYHLIYGWVKLKHGKMSSRSGNVVLGSWLLDEAKTQIEQVLADSTLDYSAEQKAEIAEKAAVAAVKYAFLRVSTTQEIAFDFAQSISFTGESGPYLQYTYARCQSLLRKSGEAGIAVNSDGAAPPRPDTTTELNEEERMLGRSLMYFPEIVWEAARDFAPSALCTYLFALAQQFNLFYAKHQILGEGVSPAQRSLRLAITAHTATVLRHGLYLLGIQPLEQM